MFRSTQWILEENNQEKYDALDLAVVRPPLSQDEIFNEGGSNDSLVVNPVEIGIIRRFEFSSKLQRMSVIVKNLQEAGFKIHVKGSPEKIRELCRPETSENREFVALYSPSQWSGRSWARIRPGPMAGSGPC